MARAKQKPVAVMEVVTRLLGRLQEEQVRRPGRASLQVFAAFDAIGAPVTTHAEPVHFRGGVLTLKVDGSPWLTELTFLEAHILERLNAALPKPMVKGLRLRLGAPRPRPPRLPPKRPLTSAEQAAVYAWTAEIKDEAVRDAVARAAATSLARGPTEGTPPSGPPGPLMAVSPPVEEPEEPELRYGYGRREVDRWHLAREAAKVPEE
ncbi:MAG: DUF721 domain-containing protein [Myxococcales bacterium]|nr:DUF721 domain-containing protein [Myxococcales bacterium]MCB9651051.1 DUF721 domain-containing protein [Deltaproteobacteria bacterium]